MDNNFKKDQEVNDLDKLIAVDEEVTEELVEEVKEAPKVEEKSKPEPKVETKVSKPKNDDTVAVFAEGNIYQAKWGELSKGYNIIKKEAADYWLAHRTVRLATPEEVAKHYGVK